MKKILTLEQTGMLLLSLYLFSYLEYSWWLYAVFFLIPDIGMVGYFINAKTGAYVYNAFHHQGVACLLIVAGFLFSVSWIAFAGIIMLGHSAADRIFGYGLKYSDSFSNTHLGTIGNNQKA